MKLVNASLTTLLLGMLSVSAQAVDIDRGQELHDENCTKCHASMMVGGDGTEIYTRSDRRIESLEALNKQVRRCKDSLGMSWPEDQIDDVVAYLNKNFYKFPD